MTCIRDLNQAESAFRNVRGMLALMTVVLACSATSQAGVVWDESSNGDISGNRLSPTAVTLAVGDNDLLGSVQGNPSDLDYLTINVPAGDVLAHLVLKSFVSTDQRGFIGIQHGATFTEPTVGTTVGNLLGYTHFGPGAGNVGLDILPSMGAGPGSQGFLAPLGPGQYTFWIQQLGAATSYDFDFQVTAVPEPSAFVLALLCAIAVAAGRWLGVHRYLRERRAYAGRLSSTPLIAMFVVAVVAGVSRATVLATATATTSQTSAPYTYSLVLHNTGTSPIDTFWFAWLDAPEKNLMTSIPTSIHAPASWLGLTSHLPGGDGYGVEFYSFVTSLAAGGTLSGFQFTSNDSPSALNGTVSVPGLGNLPVGTTFVYHGGAFSPEGARITTQVVPEPSSLVLAGLAPLVASRLANRNGRRGALSR